jgi:hypothetical protein
MIVCKLQELYRDLQVRYACGFIDKDHILHNRAYTGLCTTGDEEFNVRDMRNFILAAWHLYHEQTFLFVLNNAIKNRKLSVLSGLQLNVLCGPRQDEDKYAVLRNTIKGVVDTTNPSILMDLFNKKYSMGPYKRDSTGLKVKLDSKTYNPSNILHLDDVFVDNGERKPILEQVIERARFNQFGQILSPLECKCTNICDCKFICDLHPNVCICVYRQKSLGSTPKRLSPQYPTIHLQTPTKNRRLRADVLPKPESDVMFKRTDQKWNHQNPDSLTECSDSSMDHEDNGYFIYPLSSHLPSSATVSALSEPQLHSKPVTPLCSPLFKPPNQTVITRRIPPAPPPKPLPKPPKISFETADIYCISPLSNLGNYRGVMSSLRNRSTKGLGIERCATESDLSYRIPFEENKHFMSSPQLLARCQARYVSAGGDIPLSERESVTDPFSPKYLGVSVPKDTLLSKLTSQPSSKTTRSSVPRSHLEEKNITGKAKKKRSRLRALLQLGRN